LYDNSHARHLEPPIGRGMSARLSPSILELDLEDDRILIDIETNYAMAMRERAKSRTGAVMDKILNRFRQTSSLSTFGNRTAGPACLLVILALVWMFSPHFPFGLRAFLLALR